MSCRISSLISVNGLEVNQVKCILFIREISATLSTPRMRTVFLQKKVSPIAEPFCTRLGKTFLRARILQQIKCFLPFSISPRNEILFAGKMTCQRH